MAIDSSDVPTVIVVGNHQSRGLSVSQKVCLKHCMQLIPLVSSYVRLWKNTRSVHDPRYITPLAPLVPLPPPYQVEAELSAHENGDVTRPVEYEFLIETAAAHVPVTMMNKPATIKNTFKATRNLNLNDRSVERRRQLSCSHIQPLDVMHMNAPRRAPMREVRSPKKGMAVC